MTKFHLLTGMLLLSLASVAAGGETAKKLYCWNEGGRKICGDALPANAVDSARTELSAKSGLATGRIDRALTSDERAGAAAQAEADQQVAYTQQARLRREMAMVDSYASEGELRRAYEHRISLSQGTVKASRMGVTGLRQSLVSLLRRASEAELSGKPVPARLAANIAHQHEQLLRQQSILLQQQRDGGKIQGELIVALGRYRALKMPAQPTGDSRNGG